MVFRILLLSTMLFISFHVSAKTLSPTIEVLGVELNETQADLLEGPGDRKIRRTSRRARKRTMRVTKRSAFFSRRAKKKQSKKYSKANKKGFNKAGGDKRGKSKKGCRTN